MKYIIYFVFIAFIVILILFLKNALQPSKEELSITGTDKCGECHSLDINGNQNKVWKESKHAGAYKTLLTDKAVNFTKDNNLEPASTNKLCLGCHTTQHSFKDSKVHPTYNINEGVGCESCHGPGSRYSPAEIMKDENLFTKNGGEIGNENTCKKCHSPSGNKEMKIKEDVCPFQVNDFVYKNSLEKIKHPVNRNNFK